MDLGIGDPQHQRSVSQSGLTDGQATALISLSALVSGLRIGMGYLRDLVGLCCLRYCFFATRIILGVSTGRADENQSCNRTKSLDDRVMKTVHQLLYPLILIYKCAGRYFGVAGLLPWHLLC